ncbi:GyrI-like domain-containing protein [Nocardia beijingensis]|uniref:GyrI-like domain-containing protein n=1 Tax=Nocardia beijingensis TaxID=95162 RepID=A0ABW7WFC8_9NOCA
MTDDLAAASTAEPELLDVAEVTTAVIRDRVAPADLRDFFDRSFRLLPEILAGQGARIEGPAFCVYREVDGALDLEVGFAVDRSPRAEREVRAGCLPAGRVARIVHAGGFDGLAASWEHLRSWIAEQGFAVGPLRWEVYLTRPAPDMDPAELRTELNWPVALPESSDRQPDVPADR